MALCLTNLGQYFNEMHKFAYDAEYSRGCSNRERTKLCWERHLIARQQLLDIVLDM